MSKKKKSKKADSISKMAKKKRYGKLTEEDFENILFFLKKLSFFVRF